MMRSKVKSIVNRSIWLYIAIAVVLAVSVNRPRAASERSRYLLGIFYNEDLKNFKDGIVYFDYKTRQKPGDSYNYFLLGYCYLQLNEYQKAKQFLARALGMRPNEPTYQKYLDYAQGRLNGRNDAPLPAETIQIPVELE